MVKVKAYLEARGRVKEIRRFEVFGYFHSPAYDALVEKIQELFKVSSFKTSYKDSDGDLVVFSSEAEMKQGLEFLKENTFYVYVFPTNPQPVRVNDLVLATRALNFQ